jgi:hypothetical protein
MDYGRRKDAENRENSYPIANPMEKQGKIGKPYSLCGEVFLKKH